MASTSDRSRNTKSAQASQRRILLALVRGLLTESQAMKRLGLNSADELSLMLETHHLKQSPMDVPSNNATLVDGFTHYWRSQP